MLPGHLMCDQLTLCVLILLLLFPLILSLLCGHDELLVVAISQVAPDGLPLGDVADAGDGLAAATTAATIPHVSGVKLWRRLWAHIHGLDNTGGGGGRA